MTPTPRPLIAAPTLPLAERERLVKCFATLLLAASRIQDQIESPAAAAAPRSDAHV